MDFLSPGTIGRKHEKKKLWLIVAVSTLLLTATTGAVGAQDTAKFGTVTGTVTYLQRIALTGSAEIVVELVDVSKADAPAVVLASQRILANSRQVPFDFALTYEKASIAANGRYSVTARLFVDGGLRWVGEQSYPVITNDQFSADVILTPLSAPSAPSSSGVMMSDPTAEATATAPYATITGTVSYRQRIALPDNAVILVELVDVSKTDVPSATLASEQFFANGRQVPFSFALNYDPESIAAGDPFSTNGSYAVRATVTVDGKLTWTTDTRYPVITNGETNVDVSLVQVNG